MTVNVHKTLETLNGIPAQCFCKILIQYATPNNVYTLDERQDNEWKGKIVTAQREMNRL